MIKVRVRLKSFDDVSKFVSILNRQEGEFDLTSGRNTVDPKSVLGVLSLDISKPLQLIIYHENEILLSELDQYLE